MDDKTTKITLQGLLERNFLFDRHDRPVPNFAQVIPTRDLYSSYNHFSSVPDFIPFVSYSTNGSFDELLENPLYECLCPFRNPPSDGVY